jgi:hypothetical protein
MNNFFERYDITRCATFFCHSCESRNPLLGMSRTGAQRIPAFAGMTGSWEKLHTA